MGNVAYMSLFDTNSKKILGGCHVYQREGCIEIKKLDYNISRSIDSHTGKSHSPRKHEPFTIMKPIDQATPILFQSCANGKVLIEARIDLYRIDEEGIEENYFSYLLDNVRIISISPIIDALSNMPDMEVISLSFETLSMMYHQGNLVAVDSWEKR